MSDEYTVHLTNRKHTEQPVVDVDVVLPTLSKEKESINEPVLPATSTGTHRKTRKNFFSTNARNHPSISVQITDHTIYSVQFGKEYEVLQVRKVELPLHVVESGVILDEDKLAQAVREVISQYSETSPIQCASCVPKSQTYIQHFTLPQSSERVTYDLVCEKISHILPFSLTEVSIDFVSWPFEGMYHIIVAVVPKSIITSYVHTFTQAGCELVNLDVEAAALGRALLPQENNQRSLIVDIGAQSTALSSYSDGRLTTSLFTPVGSDKLSGIPITEAIEEVSGYEPHKQGVQSDYEDIIATLIQSIELLLLDYQETKQGKEVDAIYIVGRTPLLSIIAEYIQETVGVQTIIGNPFQHCVLQTRIGETNVTPYASVCGLMLRESMTDAFGFNLLATQAPKKKVAKQHKIIRGAFIKKHTRELILFGLVLVSLIGLLSLLKFF